MKVVTICREILSNKIIHNYPIAEFIYEQNKSLAEMGVNYEYFLIKSSGYQNYLKHIYEFRLFLKNNDYKYDIIHAHGGHIGIIANAQRKIPVITTYHGSDINNQITRLFSIFALLFSFENIFVSSNILNKVKKYVNGTVIPCGVDFNIFQPLDKIESRLELGFKEHDKLVLFAGNQQKKVKNYVLAEQVMKIIGQGHILIELREYTRDKMKLLLNAADVLLLTSFSEGSPQIIKEAMACNCPIVATDVGDIKEIIKDTKGCFATSFDPFDVAEKLKLVLNLRERTNGREKIVHLDNKLIAERIYEIYCKAINEKNK